MSFVIGLLQGAADAKERRNDREARSRDLASAAARANERSERRGTPFIPGDRGQSGGGQEAYTYDGKISDRPMHAFNRFRAAGLPDHIASGYVGNLMQESGPDIDPAAVGDNGNAFGSGQWNGPRMRAYKAYAAERGVDPTDFDTQIDFLLHEGRTTEKAAWDAVLTAKTPDEAARIASERFWRPGTPHVENRMAYARSVYQNRPADPNAAPARTATPDPTDWPWFRNRLKGGPA